MTTGWSGELRDTGWQAAILGNSWVAFGAPYPPARFRRKDGITYVQFAVKSGTLGAIGFVLPAGYRPGYYLHLISASGTTPVRADITNLGEVYINGPSNAICTLAGSFPAEQ